MTKRVGSEKFILTKDVLLPGMLFALFVRWCVAAYPYSGYGKPPMYGDFEAQRHWQEITVQTTANTWYHNTTQNDLQYWGLDYPPLTAYHSYIMGLVADWLDPESVRLFASRGYEDENHKTFMRWTVIISDIYFYVSAVLCICVDADRMENYVHKRQAKSKNIFKRVDIATTLFLLYPGIILIDHGHFQYNCVSLGLFLWATFFVIAIENDFLCTVFFCLALNYKQMELYHALPFFVYLFRKCFINLPAKKSVIHVIVRFYKLAMAVILCFIICWIPFLTSVPDILQVIHRLFPLKRGIFEDKVSNLWCFINVFVKLKTVYTNDTMAWTCLTTTAIAVLPSCIDLFLRINKKKFVLSLINVSLAFFLFSFQVHEKTILLVAIPVLIQFPEDPFMCFWFLLVSTFSMLPLLLKDGLLIPFIVTNIIHVAVYSVSIKLAYPKSGYFKFFNASLLERLVEPNKTSNSMFMNLLSVNFFFSVSGMVCLTVASVFVTPPPHYPDMYPLFVSVFSFIHFALFFLYFNFRQMSLPMCVPEQKVKKK